MPGVRDDQEVADRLNQCVKAYRQVDDAARDRLHGVVQRSSGPDPAAERAEGSRGDQAVVELIQTPSPVEGRTCFYGPVRRLGAGSSWIVPFVARNAVAVCL